MSIFSIRLNELINESGITKYKLAKELNLSKATILNWCDSKNEPKVTQIIELCKYFDVTSDFLIGLENYDGSKVEPINFTPEQPKPRMIPVAARSRGNKVRNLELSEEEIRKIQASRIKKSDI